MATRIQLRRDLACNWTATNPMLAQGEIGIETDTLKLKIGNGSSLWSCLAYYSTSSMPYPDAGIAVSDGSGWVTSLTDNSAEWDCAYGWGNHADAGYLTAETDPVVGAVTGIVVSDGAGAISAITDNSADWNCAYGWGNHADAGYVTGTPWTSEGYVTGTPWTSEGYLCSCDLSSYALSCDIPTDNCQLANGCSYLCSCDLSSYALSCTIPTDNCQLGNTCGYAIGTIPTDNCQLGNTCGYVFSCDIPTDNCQLGNTCGYIAVESDPCFTSWCGSCANVSMFCNDCGYLTTQGVCVDQYENIFSCNSSYVPSATNCRNIILGLSAGCGASNTCNNILIGHCVGSVNDSGYLNTIVGHYAGMQLDGYYNTIVGDYAGTMTCCGDNNIFLGHYAGAYFTDVASPCSCIFRLDSIDRTCACLECTNGFMYGKMDTDPSCQFLRINAHLYTPYDFCATNICACSTICACCFIGDGSCLTNLPVTGGLVCWTNSCGDGNYEVGGNWTSGVVPTIYDDVYMCGGAGCCGTLTARFVFVDGANLTSVSLATICADKIVYTGNMLCNCQTMFSPNILFCGCIINYANLNGNVCFCGGINNYCICGNANFSPCGAVGASNCCCICGDAVFCCSSAINYNNILGNATFLGACNSGTICGNALFCCTCQSGTVYGNAVFCCSINCGGYVCGNADFICCSTNCGCIQQNASFGYYSQNCCCVLGDVLFSYCSGNSTSMGFIYGNALFTCCSYNCCGYIGGNAVFEPYAWDCCGCIFGNVVSNGGCFTGTRICGDLLSECGCIFCTCVYGDVTVGCYGCICSNYFNGMVTAQLICYTSPMYANYFCGGANLCCCTNVYGGCFFGNVTLRDYASHCGTCSYGPMTYWGCSQAECCNYFASDICLYECGCIKSQMVDDTVIGNVYNYRCDGANCIQLCRVLGNYFGACCSYLYGTCVCGDVTLRQCGKIESLCVGGDVQADGDNCITSSLIFGDVSVNALCCAYFCNNCINGNLSMNGNYCNYVYPTVACSIIGGDTIFTGCVDNCCSTFRGDVHFNTVNTCSLGMCSRMWGNAYYLCCILSNCGCTIGSLSFSVAGVTLPDYLAVACPQRGSMGYDYCACALKTYDGTYWI